ncbi:MAG: PEP/pyruvate-binding domain-containing protein [Candidatus Omnitrophota bacterium]
MKNSKLRKILSLFLCGLLLLQQTGFAQVASVELNLSSRFASAGSALSNILSVDKFRPVHLRSISYDQLNNNFKLLIDKGDTKNPKTQEIESTTKDLLNYFFVGIALPNSSFWVNLRPDAPTNIIDPLLAQTEVGKILLEADLQLKKDTAEATNPQSPAGKAYWNKLYAKANELYGNQNVNIPTLTRPWIVPDEIIIRESTNNAYVYKATLKVMLEQDYLKDNSTYSFKDDRAKQLNEYSSQIIRQEIIPKLTKEINSAKRYAQLRQVYYSLILAQWFKARNLNNPNNPYAKQIDRKDLTNLKTNTPYSVDTYFNSYKQNFTQGQYNIKEPVYTPYGQVVRSYFSGGVVFGEPITKAIQKDIVPGYRLDMNQSYLTSVEGDLVHVMAEGVSRQRAYSKTDSNSSLKDLEYTYGVKINVLTTSEFDQKASQLGISNPGKGFGYFDRSADQPYVYILKGNENNRDLVMHEITEALARQSQGVATAGAETGGISGNGIDPIVNKLIAQEVASKLAELSVKTGLNISEKIKNSNELVKWMEALQEYPLLADKITAHIIVTLRMLHNSNNPQDAINFWGDSREMWKVREALVPLLQSQIPMLWKQLLVKFLPLVSYDQLLRIRDLSRELQDNMQPPTYASDDDINYMSTIVRPTGDYIAARIRDTIHRNPSNKINLILLQAYKVYLNEGLDAYREYLKNNPQTQILPANNILDDRLNFEKKAKALEKCDALISLVGDLTGKASGEIIMQSRFETWKKAVSGHSDFGIKISNLINANPDNPTDTLEYLGEIVAMRKDLQRMFIDLTGEALFVSYLLDNALETLYYVNCDKIFEDKSVNSLILMRSLLENTSLNGYSQQESATILEKLKEWSQTTSLKISNKKSLTENDWSELVKIYLDVKNKIINANTNLIIDNFYEEAAKLMGITNAEDVSADILRNDTISLLSRALSEALVKAGITQVIYAGEGAGKVRVFDNLDFLEKNPPTDNDIVILKFDLTEEQISRNITSAVSAVVFSKTGPISHLALWVKGKRIPSAICSTVSQFEQFQGQKVKFIINDDQVVLEPTKDLVEGSVKPAKEIKKIVLPRAKNKLEHIIYADQFAADNAGNKAAGLKKIPAEFLLPSFVVSSSFYDAVLNDPLNADIAVELSDYLQKAIRNPLANDISDTLDKARRLINQLVISDAKAAEILGAIEKTMGQNKDLSLVVRSSTNAEDLPGYVGAGLYGSFKNVRPDQESLAENIKKVWASVWNELPFRDRQVEGIDHLAVYPAVLIQQMYPSDYHATIYTQDPANKGKLVIQLKQGLGEPDEYNDKNIQQFSGMPYLFIYDADSHELSVKSYADINYKLILRDGVIQEVLADYNNDPIGDKNGRELLKQLAQVALDIAAKAKTPQDIEGGIRNVSGVWEFKLFQSRDQANASDIAKTSAQVDSNTIIAGEIGSLANEIAGLFRKELKKGLSDRNFDAIISKYGGVFVGEGRSGKAYKFSTTTGEMVIKFFVDVGPVEYTTFESEVRGLSRADNPLFQQYVTSARANDDKVSYIVTKFVSGISFDSEYSYSEWQELSPAAQEKYFDKIEQRIQSIPDEHWDQLVLIFKYAKEEGIIIDAKKSDNFKYTPERGFVVLDYVSLINKEMSANLLEEAAPLIVGGGLMAQIGDENIALVKSKIGEAKKRIRNNSVVIVDENDTKKGGIDFRFLPIVTQSMGSLKASMRGIPVNTLQQINLTREWSDINRLVSSGIAPSTERLKEYFAASCFKGNLDTDNQKIIACISDILRMEELTCSTTDATLKDILVVLGSGRSGEDLKLALSGVN